MPTLKPTYNASDLETILLTEKQISRRVVELAEEISSNYCPTGITIVCVLSGALVFTSDLIRNLQIPARLDCIRADSYRNSTTSTQSPLISSPLKTDIKNRHVLVIDDILDTGNTLSAITAQLNRENPASLKTCVLLDKKERREVAIEADYSGFSIPDEFVVGYGLDFAELYRNLKCIGTLKSDFQTLSIHSRNILLTD